MGLFNLPPELLKPIFLEIISVRTFKRAMRLKCVSRSSRDYVMEAIMSSDVFVDTFKSVYARDRSIDYSQPEERFNICYEYITRRVLKEGDPSSLRGQVKELAERLCELSSQHGPAAMDKHVKGILGTMEHTDIRNLLNAGTTETLGSFRMSRYLLLGAVNMSYVDVVRQLLIDNAEEYRAGHHIAHGSLDHCAMCLAALTGNLEMVKLLAHSQPVIVHGANGGGIWPTVAHALEHVSLGTQQGHCEIFEYLVDALEHVEFPGEFDAENVRRMWEFTLVQMAVGRTPFPSNFLRGRAFLSDRDDWWAKVHASDTGNICNEIGVGGRTDMLRHFLAQADKMPADEAREYKRNRLKAIVKPGNAENVKLALEHGADPNQLSKAAALRWYEMARLLIDHGADVNHWEAGLVLPPIVVAVMKEDTSMFRLLRENGAVLDTPETGPQAMAFAKMLGLESMVDVLVSEGLDENVVLQHVPRYRLEKWWLSEDTVHGSPGAQFLDLALLH
ncbi:hypothetical protein CkaCkLH20_03635 [Colletotrichum karsti]|uniref:Uncharacterized protein n=1 Tax=Colletotrichum karsti TaxID=1095194 RepID=A0A9P6IA15_9PEZI|nr:uncharacterized protein CkaCkLH20_03635 [Colletotrichum karsti]KAF9878735.1 hypothetical protein CkaCkLH20_03635 [Colletotrichum karsti]